MAILESSMLLFWPFVVVVLIVGLLSFFTVQTAQVAVITRFGKFLRVAQPGLNWKWPFIDRVAGRVSLRVNQITLTMETKTKDNVFVTIPISVQNRVRPEKVYDAFYKLSDPMQQIQAYVEQVILGHVPGMTLDEVFASQSGIAAAVKQELDADMAGFGYEIVNVLVTDIVPDAKVKSAMNDINAAQREQVAANARGEAEKILVVKKAEAEAQSKALQGQASPISARLSSKVCKARFSSSSRPLAPQRRRSCSWSWSRSISTPSNRSARWTRPTRCSFRIRPPPCATSPSRSCSRCWWRTGRRAKALPLKGRVSKKPASANAISGCSLATRPRISLRSSGLRLLESRSPGPTMRCGTQFLLGQSGHQLGS
jgi:regulator of protease activity HflC (stomatin/prohibitin superfamily)